MISEATDAAAREERVSLGKGQWITKQIQGLLEQLKNNVGTKDAWKVLKRHPHIVGALLATVCAFWTFLSSAEQFSKGDSSSLLQPHGAQILTVLRLLGIGSADACPSLNHLAQVGTGEGKSISLGLVAAVFALLGTSVHVVCFSPYLSQRDYNAFEPLFGALGIKSLINYCAIDQLCNDMMHKVLLY